MFLKYEQIIQLFDEISITSVISESDLATFGAILGSRQTWVKFIFWGGGGELDQENS